MTLLHSKTKCLRNDLDC